MVGNGVLRVLWAGVVAAVIAHVAAGMARAQSRPATEDGGLADAEADLLRLLNTPVISASKVAQPSIDAPAVVSPLTPGQLEDYGQWTFTEVLYRQPGFAQSQLNTFRNVDARGIHEGFINNHILMLIDGVPHNMNVTGEAQLFETPLFFARSIEVLRGPGSAL